MTLVERIVRGLSAALGYNLPDVQIGLFTGVLATSFAGFIVFRVNIWWKAAMKPFKLQQVTQKTDKTPAEVTSTSCSTLLAGAVSLLALVVLLWSLG